jgi:hypothetical protein
MKRTPTVTLFPPGNEKHSTQVIAGFDSLASEGLIRVVYGRSGFAERVSKLGLFVKFDEGPGIVFDMHDSSSMFVKSALDEVDWYFKRTFEFSKVPANTYAAVRPLGPNYDVMSSAVNVFSLRRAIAWRSVNEAKRIVRASLPIPGTKFAAFRGIDSDISSEPNYSSRRVLFLARCWDPKSADIAGDQVAQEDRHSINESRASLLRRLRRELGSNFTGGFSQDDFTVRNYPDLVVSDTTLTMRANYLSVVKAHAICIATRGLHGSVGWKFGEYLAMSRAIVSERFSSAFPFPIVDGEHYRGYRTVDECVEEVHCLLDDPGKARAMMDANSELYISHLNPRALLLGALNCAGLNLTSSS